jgi:hypothetical protein
MGRGIILDLVLKEELRTVRRRFSNPGTWAGKAWVLCENA